MAFSFPIHPDHTKFMGGDKVRSVKSGNSFRVKARFASGYGPFMIDYITLQDLDSKQEYTIDYFDVLPELELICHPIKSK